MRRIFVVLAMLVLLMLSAMPAMAQSWGNNWWDDDNDRWDDNNGRHDNNWGDDDNDWRDHDNDWWRPSYQPCSWFPWWGGWWWNPCYGWWPPWW